MTSLNLNPQESKEIFFNTSNIVQRAGVRYFLTVEAKTRNSKPLVPKKHLVAWEQFELPLYVPLSKKETNAQFNLVSQENDRLIQIKSNDVHIVFNKETGFLESYEVGMVKYLKQPIVSNFGELQMTMTLEMGCQSVQVFGKMLVKECN